jgi:glucokinase
MNALVIDLGGSHATCAVVRDGAILASQSLAADGRETLAEMLPSLSRILHGLLDRTHVNRADCAALVLGFCGIVSAREKRVLATNKKFDDAPGLDLNQWCRTEFQVPFLIENDARLALLGEHAFGAGRGAEDVVMVTLGSGIGGAALLGGRLLQSRHGLAGTIGGHFPVVLDGRICSCGNRGCAESEAATAFLGEIYREQPGGAAGTLSCNQKIGFAELFDAADRGDPPAITALEHCMGVWSVLTVALIHAYDPEVVVFGGLVLKRAGQILPHLQEYVNAHAWTPRRKVPLRAALLGSDAALLGATPLIELTD